MTELCLLRCYTGMRGSADLLKVTFCVISYDLVKARPWL